MAMDLTAFQLLLDTYGGDPAHWPDRDREAALTLAERSDDARAMLDRARRLDAMMVSGLASEAGVNLRYRITAAAQLTRQPESPASGLLERLLAPWRLGAAAAAAASIALGMLVGLETSIATDLYDEPETTMNLAAVTYGQFAELEDIQ